MEVKAEVSRLKALVDQTEHSGVLAKARGGPESLSHQSRGIHMYWMRAQLVHITLWGSHYSLGFTLLFGVLRTFPESPF